MKIEVIDGVLNQWDSGRKIKISNPNEDVSKVQFYLSNEKTGLGVEPKEVDGIIIADIPNIYLQSNVGIDVYIVNISGDVKRTIAFRHLHVDERPQPPDYVYTET